MTLWTAAHQSSLSLSISPSLLRLMSIELMMPSSHLTLCHPLLLSSVFSSIKIFFSESVMPSKHLVFCYLFCLLPSIFPRIRVLSKESALYISWPNYWIFSISPSSEYSGLISFRIDWLDLLAVQGTLKSLLQHRSSKASIFWCSAFFMVRLSHPYMTTGKTRALPIWTLVSK